jgi:hypothetical protein
VCDRRSSFTSRISSFPQDACSKWNTRQAGFGVLIGIGVIVLGAVIVWNQRRRRLSYPESWA